MLNITILLNATYSGLIAVIIDIIIRQLIMQNTIEKKHLPKECIEYRRTNHHFFSIFLVAVIVYLLFTLFHWNKKYIN